MSLQPYEPTTLGGPGSGHHGHTGRKGGGSTSIGSRTPLKHGVSFEEKSDKYGKSVNFSLPDERGGLLVRLSNTSAALKNPPKGFAGVSIASVKTKGAQDGLKLYEAALQYVHDRNYEGLASNASLRSKDADRFWDSLRNHGANVSERDGWSLLRALEDQSSLTTLGSAKSGHWGHGGGKGGRGNPGGSTSRGSGPGARGSTIAHHESVTLESKDGPITFQTGTPVTFPYFRQGSGFSDPKSTLFGQHIEPHGPYVSFFEKGAMPSERQERGVITFRSPLVLSGEGSYNEGKPGEVGPLGWKKKLSLAYGGKTGLALSHALHEDGYDGIVTVILGTAYPYVGEIVDLRKLRSASLALFPLEPARAARLLAAALLRVQGSASSGNWGHVGRPGLVGGSGPKGQIHTPEFKAWFGDSKIVDENGKPLVVFHGTPSSGSQSNNRFVRSEQGSEQYPVIESFDTETQGVTDSQWLGQGTYFTPDPSYAEEFGDRIMPVYLSIQKPFEVHDDSTNSLENHFRFVQSLQNLDGLPEKLKLDLSMPKPRPPSEHYPDDPPTLFDLVTDRDGRSLLLSRRGDAPVGTGFVESKGTTPEAAIFAYRYKDEYQGFLLHTITRKVGSKEFRQLLEKNGYDGVIELDDEKRLKEIVAFKPTQIKSSIGNTGTFSKDTKLITGGGAGSGHFGHSGGIGGRGNKGGSTKRGGLVEGIDGKPLRMYRRVTKSFDENREGLQFWTDDREATADYGGMNDTRLVSAFLAIKKPYVMQDDAAVMRLAKLQDLRWTPGDLYSDVITDETPALLEIEGYDGIKLDDSSGRVDHVTYVTWRSRQIVSLKTAGGAGSGNFGHVGRPGQIGGSGKGTSSTGSLTSTVSPSGVATIEEYATSMREMDRRIRIVKDRATMIAEQMGVDPNIIHVVHQEPRGFTVGNQQFQEAGHYNSKTGLIEINAQNSYDDRMSVTQGIVAHEVFHAQFDAVTKAQEREHAAIVALSVSERKRLFEEPEPNLRGNPKPEAMSELKERFPASAAFAETWGDTYLGTPPAPKDTSWPPEAIYSDMRDHMVNEDGHSAYAKAYWLPGVMVGSPGVDRRAVNETLAEVTRAQVVPDSWSGMDNKPAANSPWVKLARDIRAAYPKVVAKRLKAAGSASSGNWGHQGGEGGPGNPGGSTSARQQWKESLTSEERQALQAWAVRSETLNESIFEQAIDRAPHYKGTIYRGSDFAQTKEGVHEKLDKILTDKTITLSRDSSFTTDREAARGFTGDVLYIVEQTSARDVRGAMTVTTGGKFTSEEEVIVRKGTKYEVTQVTFESRTGQPFGRSNTSSISVSSTDAKADRPHMLYRNGHYVVRMREIQ